MTRSIWGVLGGALLVAAPAFAQELRPRSGTAAHVPAETPAAALLLEPGDVLVVGTCGVGSAVHHGDTTLDLIDSRGVVVMSNDDACGGTGSRLTYHVPADGGGLYAIRAGCYSGVCGGTIAWELSSAQLLSEPRGTLPHLPGTTASIALARGQRLVAGTCGLEGASHEGDTMLRVIDPSGVTVASSDDACGGYGSYVEHVAERSGTYTIGFSCYSSASCGGTLAYAVDTVEPPPPVPAWRITAAARGVVGVDNPGGAFVGDLAIEWRPFPLVVVRLAGTPAGLGGGMLGGIAAGSLHLAVGLELGIVELGGGGGAAVLASRFGNIAAQEIGVGVVRGRIGLLHMFHVEAQVAFAGIHRHLEVMTLDVTARAPFRDFDLALRGAGGHDGVALGEAVLVLWLLRETSRKVLGLSIHAGGAGVFHQPLCRFGTACTAAHWYAGPMAGLGLEWHP